MDNNNSQFVNGLMEKMLPYVESNNLRLVKDILTIYSNDFDIVKKSTELSTIVDYFPECAKAYLVTLKIEGKSEGTIKNYYSYIKRFFDYVQLKPEQVKKPNVLQYINSLKCNDNTRNHALTILKAFFSWCVNEDYFANNPCKNIKSIKYQKKKPQHLTDMELELLRNACTTVRERAIVEFFYSTGCRVDEVSNLKKSDLNLLSKDAKVIGKGNKERPIYLSPKAVIELNKYFLTRTDDSEYVFVNTKKPYNKISTQSMRDIFDKIGARANINKHIHPHLLRHTNATLALEKGMPIEEVQRMLGHANINTTLIYAEVADKEVKRHHSKCLL